MSLARAPPPAIVPRADAPRPDEVAWVAVVPCALVVLAAILLLGPPLGHAFLDPTTEGLWPDHVPSIFGTPEPVKHARYLIALLGPVLLAAIVLTGARRPQRLMPANRRALVVAGQVATIAFLAAAVAGQYGVLFPETPPLPHIFQLRTIAIAIAIGLLVPPALRRPQVARLAARCLPDTRARRIGCLLVAILATALWLVPAIDTERTVGNAALGELITWTMDDPFAVLNGRTPLVDFHPLYAQLWPYVSAGELALLGTTMTAYTIAMTAASGLALVAVYATLRRVARSSALGLALYLPLLATGFLTVYNLSNVGIFSIWPIRYGGAYLLAWLTARHLDGAWPRRTWPLFGIGGIVLINNVEFGVAALAATVVALACATPQRSWRSVARLVAGAGAGVLGAALLVSLLTLLRSGQLPDFGLLDEYARIFGVIGLVSMDMPVLGLQLVLYATFVAAIGTAAVRVASRSEDRLTTSMLAWSGAFGLVAASYYVGRSDAVKLIALFSAWSFALGLLMLVVGRELAARSWRRPSLAELTVLAGFAFTACSLTDVPTPWSQADRLRSDAPKEFFKQRDALRFVAAHTRRGEKVAILIRLGHRVAYDLGITNAAPYSMIGTMFTRGQWQALVDILRREHVHKVFLGTQYVYAQHRRALAAAGYSRRTSAGRFSEWVGSATAPR